MMQLLLPATATSTPARQPLAAPRHAVRCERCTTGRLFLDDDTESGNALPAERMATTIAQLLGQPSTPEEHHVRLLREAGFQRSARFFSVLGGGITAWIAR